MHTSSKNFLDYLLRKRYTVISSEKMIMWIYFILIQKVYTMKVHMYFNGISWFNASNLCGEHGLENDLPTLSNIDEFGNKAFWIGVIQYEELTPWIELMGCYPSDMEQRQKENPVNGSIGLCQHQCHSQTYFSYQNNTNVCQCLTNEAFEGLPKLSINNCTRNPFINTTWVYKRFYYNGSDIGAKKCLVSKCYGNGVYVMPEDCNTQNGYLQTICDDDEAPTGQSYYLNFFNAKKGCFTRNTNLMSPHNCAKPYTVYSWTSAFRTNIRTVESTVKEDPGKLSTLGCLYGIKRKTSEVNINRTSCDEKLKYFVCKSSFQSDKNIEEGTSNVGPIVAGIMGGLITISVVMVIVVCKIRKRTNGEEVKSSEHSSTTKYHDDNIFVQKVTSKQNGLIVDQRKPQYAVVVKEKNRRQDKQKPEYPVVCKNLKPQMQEDHYTVASEEEYDKLNNVMTRKTRQEPNIYAIAEKCDYGEYDTVKGMSASNEPRADGLYDTNITNGN